MPNIDYKQENITIRAQQSGLWKMLEKQIGDSLPYLLERYLLLENWKRDRFDSNEHRFYSKDEVAFIHILMAEVVTVLLSQEERIRALDKILACDERHKLIFKPKASGRIRWGIRIEWKLEDFWIGAFWRREKATKDMDIWICVLPCIPIHIFSFRDSSID